MGRLVTHEDVADYFIALSNSTENLMTNMQLQKLVYYAQAWHLAIHRRPMFEATFEAWVHGPVLRGLYAKYRGFGWHPIEREDLTEDRIPEILGRFPGRSSQVLGEVADQYLGSSAYELERLVHQEDPWKRARGKLPPDAPSSAAIQEDWMADFYRRFLK